MIKPQSQSAAASPPRRIFVFNGGFLRSPIRKILAAAGFKVTIGLPKPNDTVAIWGNSPTSRRGLKITKRTGAAVLRVEDAFLRSVKTGRDGAAPLGLCLDHTGVHFDGSQTSDLERLLLEDPLDHSSELAKARALMARIRRLHLSKYNLHDPTTPPPEPGYVLIVDQTDGDASLLCCSADRARFLEMLTRARLDHPGTKILIKTHPETNQGHRTGHFLEEDLVDPAIQFYSDTCSPWDLLDGAIAVYTVSSQLGFEAILAGHKPIVFGQPFYAGWGLTVDEMPIPRRQRRLTAAQLFLGAYVKYPVWFDPYMGKTCDISRVIDILESQSRAYREDRLGWIAHGIRLWKRPHFQAFFGREKAVRFRGSDPSRRHMVWASNSDNFETVADATRVEDGFLRSVGLGAALTPPVSLSLDDQGIYYDPSRPSRLETLINATLMLTEDQQERVNALKRSIRDASISKYNLNSSTALPQRTDRNVILVVGQVEDDASIRKGTGKIRTNRALLTSAREANPDAEIWYKPHPDVEAGLRQGKVPDASLSADQVLTETDPIAALLAADEIWTMTSLLGFEALIHGKPVTCLGSPFYAGWGLTRDLGLEMPRRTTRPTLEALIHAALIDYPRYHDPVTGLPCPVEVAVERLRSSTALRGSLGLRMLAKLQGLFASFYWIWR